MAAVASMMTEMQGADEMSAPFLSTVIAPLKYGGAMTELHLLPIPAQHLLQRQAQAGDTFPDDFRP